MTTTEQPEMRSLTVAFTTDEYHRLIGADHLAQIGNLAEFTRRATLDKIRLIERLAARGGGDAA